MHETKVSFIYKSFLKCLGNIPLQFRIKLMFLKGFYDLLSFKFLMLLTA